MKAKLSTRQLCVCALFTALMCVLGPISVPIGPIPVALTNLVIFLAAYILGRRGALISVSTYLLLGFCGLPVFTQYQGGLDRLIGPTGGYIVGYLFVAWIGGFTIERCDRQIWKSVAGLALGAVVLYIFGTAWFMILTKTSIMDALTLCVFPFIAIDAAKIFIAVGMGKALYGTLTRAGLIPEIR